MVSGDFVIRTDLLLMTCMIKLLTRINRSTTKRIINKRAFQREMNSNNRKRKARKSREETLSAFCQKVTKYFDRRSDLTSVKSFKRQNASSQYFGVMYIKSQKKWRAQICAAGTKQHVGSFDTEVEAAYARDKTFIYLFGDEDKLALNFPGYWVSREAHERESIYCSDSPFGEEVVSREAHE